ncbi:hypothetical protein LCGC14_2517550 [marine sediment metagenome]|uniref:ATP synthase protein I n=1 Tax=marine sediment metagenome TaxID=412755 RepID=A0A0F9DQS6_9ZZZZ
MGEKGALKDLLSASTLGIHLVAATFVGLAVGYFLDGFFGTKPWLTMIFLFLGIGTGFRDIFRMIKRQNDQEQKDQEGTDDGPGDGLNDESSD